MYWDAESLCSFNRSLSAITSVGVFNSITMVCEGELVKRLEFEALIGQSRGGNCVNERMRALISMIMAEKAALLGYLSVKVW